MNVQQQQIPSIDAYFSLKNAVDNKTIANDQTNIHEKIALINKREFSNVKQDGEITKEQVDALNDSLRSSKSIRDKCWNELSAGQKVGYVFSLIFSFGATYRRYVPKINVSEFISSVDKYHDRIKAKKLVNGMDVPLMREDQLNLVKTDRCFRVWKDSDRPGHDVTVTVANGSEVKNYILKPSEGTEAAGRGGNHVVFQNRVNKDEVLILDSQELNQFFGKGAAKSDNKNFGLAFEKALQQKLPSVKPFGQTKLDALLGGHVVSEKEGNISVRLRDGAKKYYGQIYAVEKKGNQYTIKMSKFNEQGEPVIKDIPVVVDSQGNVQFADKKFSSVDQFKAELTKGKYLDDLEGEVKFAGVRNQAVADAKKAIRDGADKLKLYESNLTLKDGVRQLIQHVEAKHVTKMGGFICSDPYKDNKMYLAAVVDGAPKAFDIDIKDNGKIVFKGQELDPKAPNLMNTLLDGLNYVPMAEARAQYYEGVSENTKLCDIVKYNSMYYGYDPAPKFEEWGDFFPQAQLAGACLIMPKGEPDGLVRWLAKGVANAFGAEGVEKYLTSDFKKFEIFIHNGGSVKSYEVDIDVNAKEKPFKFAAGKDKEYASPDAIIKELLGEVLPVSKKTLDERMETCKETEESFKANVISQDERNQLIESNDITNTFVEGDYSIIKKENTKGEFEIAYYKGEGDNCKVHYVSCSTRLVPGKIVVGGKTFDTVGRYLLGSLAIVPKVRGNLQLMQDVPVAEPESIEPEQPVVIEQSVGAQLVVGDVSGRKDYVPDAQLKSEDFPKAQKANKYAVTWDDTDGAVIKLYRGDGVSDELVIRRQGNKYLVNGQEGVTYSTLDALVSANVGTREPVRPLGYMLDAVVASKAKTTGDTTVVEEPKTTQKVVTPKPAVAIHSLSAEVRQDLGYTVKDKYQAVGRRALIACMGVKKPENLSKEDAQELMKLICGDESVDNAKKYLYDKNAKQLGIGGNFPKTLTWASGFKGAEAQKVSLNAIQDFFMALKARAE